MGRSKSLLIFEIIFLSMIAIIAAVLLVPRVKDFFTATEQVRADSNARLLYQMSQVVLLDMSDAQLRDFIPYIDRSNLINSDNTDMLDPYIEFQVSVDGYYKIVTSYSNNREIDYVFWSKKPFEIEISYDNKIKILNNHKPVGTFPSNIDVIYGK